MPNVVMCVSAKYDTSNSVKGNTCFKHLTFSNLKLNTHVFFMHPSEVTLYSRSSTPTIQMLNNLNDILIFILECFKCVRSMYLYKVIVVLEYIKQCNIFIQCLTFVEYIELVRLVRISLYIYHA